MAGNLNNLAWIYERLERDDEAERLHRSALAIRKEIFGPSHPDVAGSIKNLAGLMLRRGQIHKAITLYRQALEINSRSLGANHPVVAKNLAALATALSTAGRGEEAVSLNRRALQISEQALGAEHPAVAQILSELAFLYVGTNRLTEALFTIRRATAILQSRNVQASNDRLTEVLENADTGARVFQRHVAIAAAYDQAYPKKETGLTNESFKIAQLARSTSVGLAISRMAARFAAGNDELAATVRARQDARAQWRAIDSRLVDGISLPTSSRNLSMEERLRTQRTALEDRLRSLDSLLAEQFPDYAELAVPQPLSVKSVRALLGTTEAVLAFLVTPDSTFVWVVTQDAAEIVTVRNFGERRVDALVTRIRATVDPGDPVFDQTAAYDLYRELLAPNERLLEDISHIFVVPDGALQSLPLSLLVTKKPESGTENKTDYRNVAWFLRKFATTTLPSVSSLNALRRVARNTKGQKPFIGFGNPALLGQSASISRQTLAKLYRGAVADVGVVRRLPPLPETADELYAMAAWLGAERNSVYLQETATEAAVKSLNLADHRIIAFATHGLVSGDLIDITEPALVLTPPKAPSELDDGLLTASEITQLRLDADLVILSACNTAASDGRPGAEGLSGLAKAFLYAGSRSLLVSHWPVESFTTVKLTTGMLANLAAEPHIGKAEALRRSMLDLIESAQSPLWAHPMFWAPFTIVGEGGGQPNFN